MKKQIANNENISRDAMSMFSNDSYIITQSMDKIKTKINELGSEERIKLEKLLRENKETKDDNSDKMKWMYQGDKIDDEDYLLGKAISDKHFIKDNKEPITPVAGSTFDDVVKRRTELDMQAKMKEDPLFIIKAKEDEAKKKLLLNPIKLKQLKKIAGITKHKKEKKKKKHKRKTDDEDSDDGVMKKYLELVKKKEDERRARIHEYQSRPISKQSGKSKKLTEEEKEKKRLEMMKNAKSREEERIESLKRHRESEKEEDEKLKTRKEDMFTKAMMSSHAEESSVEERLRRNRYNIQKSNNDFETKFTKR